MDFSIWLFAQLSQARDFHVRRFYVQFSWENSLNYRHMYFVVLFLPLMDYQGFWTVYLLYSFIDVCLKLTQLWEQSARNRQQIVAEMCHILNGANSACIHVKFYRKLKRQEWVNLFKFNSLLAEKENRKVKSNQLTKFKNCEINQPNWVKS